MSRVFHQSMLHSHPLRATFKDTGNGSVKVYECHKVLVGHSVAGSMVDVDLLQQKKKKEKKKRRPGFARSMPADSETAASST